MTKPVTVRDRNGKIVTRPDGKLLAGDAVQSIRVPLNLMDGAGGVSAATLNSAAVILGDGFDEPTLAKLSDEAARHAVVRTKLGATAEGRSVAYLDAAWGALAGTGTTTVATPSGSAASGPIGLTDAQRAIARDAIARATLPVQQPGRHVALTDAERKAGQDRIRGAYAAMKCELGDAWRGGAQPDTVLDARTEAMFRDGKITDTPTNRARAEMDQALRDGWKEGRP